MQILNLATASVDTTAGGSFVLTAAEATLGVSQGMTCVVVNPSVDIVLVDGGGTSPAPGGVAGTVANSPWVCPAGVPTVITHRSGPLKAISTSGTATVKRSIGYGA
jgi:hypothetical protein